MFKQLRLVVLATLLLASYQRGLAAVACPWMTQGSAAKLLGGAVAATIQAADDKHGWCSFFRSDGKVSFTLAVMVGGNSVGTCPAASPALRGIGNEAQFCGVRQSSTESVEQISSRVRDIWFTATLSVHGPRGAAQSTEVRHDILDQAAELVAGNLF